MKKQGKKPVHPYLIALGSEIKRVRNLRKLSLEVLGGEIGLDGPNLQKIELGQNLTISTLLKLCICLEITPSKLLDKITWDLNKKDLDILTTPRTIKKKPSKKQR